MEPHLAEGQSATHPSPVVGTDRLVLVFDYRTLVEAEDIDVINFEAWKEVLDSFGYGELSFPHFMRSLVFKSPSEVMTSLCPYTTKVEWGPVLNKRIMRLNREVSGLCYAELLPIVGVKDFVLDCTKKALVTSIFLSPFPDDVTRRMLELAELGPYIDLVHSYVDREYALLEALEMINIRPHRIPEGIEHRWSDDEHRTVVDDSGEVVRAPHGSDEVSRSLGVLNPAEIVVLTSDVYTCQKASELGCKTIGVTYNGGYYGCEHAPSIVATSLTAVSSSSSAPISSSSATNVGGTIIVHHCTSDYAHPSDTENKNEMATTATQTTKAGERGSPARISSAVEAHTDVYEKGNHEQCLLNYGASVVVADYSQLKYDYLTYLKAPPAPKLKKKD